MTKERLKKLEKKIKPVNEWPGYPCEACRKNDLPSCDYKHCQSYRAFGWRHLKHLRRLEVPEGVRREQ